MDFEPLLSWLRFANAELSPRAAHAILDRFGDPREVFDLCPETLRELPEVSEEQAVRLLDPARIPTEKQLEAMERLQVRLITRDDADYPQLLREIPDRPAYLFVRGDFEERDRFAVAVVGTRRPTPYGREIASALSRDLVELGFTVVSGGAVGIDSAAHYGALRAGGRTLVVLGCGLDVPYPAGNQRMFSEILEQRQGVILTEYPMGATPESWRFPVRNRLISGLAMGVVVVEAGKQSGALITTTTAAEQGRDVMAIPGNIDRPASEGTNALIMDGAALVTCAHDVVRHLGVTLVQAPEEARAAEVNRDLPEDQKAVLAQLSLTPVHIDAIAAAVQMTTSQAAAVLTLLELRGLVHRQPGSTYIRAL